MDDFVVCEICGEKLKLINHIHLKKHNITFKEYKERYPEAKTISDSSYKKKSESLSKVKHYWGDKTSKSLKEAYKKNPVGWGRTGHPASEETRKIQSEKNKGRIVTEEQREYISKKTKEAFEKNGYVPWNKGLTKENNSKLKDISDKNTGKTHSEETRQKLRELSTGRTLSDESKKKLSFAFSGDKNPSKRRDVRKKLVENHASKDPENWKIICKKIGDAQRGIKFSEERKESIAKGQMRSARYGSKSQRIAFEYLRKYFKLFYKTNVYGNDHYIFFGLSKNYSVDISIPEYKIAVEWDGRYHWNLENEAIRESVEKTISRDKIKESHLKDIGWNLIRIKDENTSNQKYRQYAIQEIRKIIPALKELINNSDRDENYLNNYSKKDYIRINLSDLSERKKCKICGCWIIKKKNKLGYCRSCFDANAHFGHTKKKRISKIF